jgi:rhamnose transport system permease protein
VITTVECTVPVTGSAAPSRGPRLVNRVLRTRGFALAAVLLLLTVVAQTGNNAFLSEQGVKDLLLNATILVLVATGQAMVVLTRNVDPLSGFHPRHECLHDGRHPPRGR